MIHLGSGWGRVVMNASPLQRPQTLQAHRAHPHPNLDTIEEDRPPYGTI